MGRLFGNTLLLFFSTLNGIEGTEDHSSTIIGNAAQLIAGEDSGGSEVDLPARSTYSKQEQDLGCRISFIGRAEEKVAE